MKSYVFIMRLALALSFDFKLRIIKDFLLPLVVQKRTEQWITIGCQGISCSRFDTPICLIHQPKKKHLGTFFGDS